MTDSADWGDGARILCVRLDNLGDVLLTTPAFRALKETWPTCQLTLLTSSAGAAIAPYIPDLDHILRFDVPWVGGDTSGQTDVPALVDLLKARAFDAAILFTVQSQSPLPAALLCYLAGIPRVLGYCRENPYRLITDWVPDPEVLMATRHEVERQLALVGSAGAYTTRHTLSLSVDPTDRQYTRQLLIEQGIDINQPWLVLHPGVSEPKRRYPASQYVRALQLLRKRTNYQFVLTGSAAERPLTTAIERELRQDRPATAVLDLAGQLTVGQLAGLLADAPLLIANNTGPVHIAAATGTPVVVLYAKTNPQHTPWQVPNRVLYFDVPADLRSKNRLLQQFPADIPTTASPEAIVGAVGELVRETTVIR